MRCCVFCSVKGCNLLKYAGTPFRVPQMNASMQEHESSMLQQHPSVQPGSQLHEYAATQYCPSNSAKVIKSVLREIIFSIISFYGREKRNVDVNLRIVIFMLLRILTKKVDNISLLVSMRDR